MTQQAAHIVVIAGEVSGDVLGGGLIQALNGKREGLKFTGVGGPQMTAAGLQAIFPISDIAVMGFGDVVRRLPYLFGKRDDVVRHVIETNPDLVICIDAPDFNHRVAKLVRKQAPHIPIINYVTPSVWFWRSKRAKKMAEYFDHGLCLLPFEPEVMARLGGPPCHYVGHRASEMRASAQQIAAFSKRYKLSTDQTVLALIPGSRASEIRNMLPIFLDSVECLREQGMDVTVFIPTVSHIRNLVVEGLGAHAATLIDDESEKLALYGRATLALATSGTVALELGLAQTPMIIAYRTAGLFPEVVGKWIAQTPSVNLVNLVLDEPVVPELLYDRLSAENIAHLASQYLSNDILYRETENALHRFCEIMLAAGPSPDHNAAQTILDLNLLP